MLHGLWEEQVPSVYHQYGKVFSDQESTRFPGRRPWDHAIDLLPEAPTTLNCKVYPLAEGQQEVLDKFLDEHLAKGYIRWSNSPFTSPFFFVKKKDGKLRPVQDYRALNNWTVRNTYPLPLIKELISKLVKKKWFTKLDIRWGYNNVRIKEGDEWKTSFKTNRGLFECLVMFFGLTNSPATFQTMMDALFDDLVTTGNVIIYMDDILIVTDSDCYSSFDLSSIYAVKYHLTTRIHLYQPSFLISTIPGPRYRFPAFSDLPVI